MFKCNRCDIAFDNNYTPVLGYGSSDANIMIIGEAPGYHEVKDNMPFTGKAGRKLTYILNIFDINRNDLYITNIVKCRPPANRLPTNKERDNCKSYLLQEIKFIDPYMIILLGSFALSSFFNNEMSISKLRGKMFKYSNKVICCTFHPAYILRNPQYLETVILDFKKFFIHYSEINTDLNINFNI